MDNSNALKLLKQSREIVIKMLKRLLNESGPMPMTIKSAGYRQRAAAIGDAAEAELDHAKLLELIQEAVHWIQLAENEEMLAAGRNSNH